MKNTTELKPMSGTTLIALKSAGKIHGAVRDGNEWLVKTVLHGLRRYKFTTSACFTAKHAASLWTSIPASEFKNL